MLKHLKIASQEFRAGTIVAARADSEDERVVELSFSSEEPFKRWWGTEILGHQAGEVDTSFVGSGRAPLLLDHNRSVEKQIGVIQKIEIANGRGTAWVRFGKGAMATEILDRIKDGELGNISVGYEIQKLRLESEEDGHETYRATLWKPFEISVVTVPADPSVGVGRSAAAETLKTITIETHERETPMTSPNPTPAVPAAPAALDENAIRQAAQTAERGRISEIGKIGSTFNMRDKADEAIAAGVTVEQFRGAVLTALGDAAPERMSGVSKVGLSEKEARNFSMLRMIRAKADPSNRKLQDDATFEYEVCEAAAEQRAKFGQSTRGFAVPSDVLLQPLGGNRAMSYGTPTAGGNLVATDLDSANFIDILRNSMKVRSLGATVLTDLTGDLDIPRQTAAATISWGAEAADAASSDAAIDQLAFRLKTASCFTDVTRKLLNQSGTDMEAFVRRDLAMAVALGVDFAALHGTGASNQPRGIAATAGIGAVVGGANGAAPDWADIVGLETAVSVANADANNLAYLTNAKVRGALKQTEKAATTAQFVWSDKGEMNGNRAEVSNQVSSTLTKGTATSVCSAIFYGNWADLIIAFWSGVDIVVDPFTLSKSGGVRIVVHQDCDVAPRHPQSFSAMLDALTA